MGWLGLPLACLLCCLLPPSYLPATSFLPPTCLLPLVVERERIGIGIGIGKNTCRSYPDPDVGILCRSYPDPDDGILWVGIGNANLLYGLIVWSETIMSTVSPTVTLTLTVPIPYQVSVLQCSRYRDVRLQC